MVNGYGQQLVDRLADHLARSRPARRRAHLRARAEAARATPPRRPRATSTSPRRAVAHPAAQTRAARLLTHEPAKADALHAAAITRRAACVTCCSSRAVPTSGTKRTGATSRVSIASASPRDELQRLLLHRAHGHEHPSALGELLDERLRHRRRTRAHEDRVVRRVLAPADGAVAEEQRHVVRAALWRIASRAICISAGMRSIEKTCATRCASSTVW